MIHIFACNVGTSQFWQQLQASYQSKQVIQYLVSLKCANKYEQQVLLFIHAKIVANLK